VALAEDVDAAEALRQLSVGHVERDVELVQDGVHALHALVREPEVAALDRGRSLTEKADRAVVQHDDEALRRSREDARGGIGALGVGVDRHRTSAARRDGLYRGCRR
jgi:hypothetical protein